MQLTFKALFSLTVILPLIVALPHNNMRDNGPGEIMTPIDSTTDSSDNALNNGPGEIMTPIDSPQGTSVKAREVGLGEVLTPVGPRPKDSTVLVPNDASLHFTDGAIQVVHNNGTVLHTAPRESSPMPAPAFATGWVAYAHFTVPSSTPVKSFTTTWTVPPVPATNHGQTVFLFNGLEPSTYDSILQPVLQWGPSAAGGGPYWQVASWFVTATNAYHSSLINVNVGQTLTGVMTVDAPNQKYTSSFTGISQSSLTINNGPQLVWATETLESYNIYAKSDYPTGKTSFTNINLVGPSSVSWSAVSDPADGITTTIVRNGGVNAQVDIRYT